MKIAITADVHLTDQPKHEARANALRDILAKCKEMEVNALVIAGDLFDKNVSNPSIFEKIVRAEMPLPFKITIIPGNHDHRLTFEMFSTELPIRVVENPEFNNTDFGMDTMLIPYGLDRRIGSELSKFKEKLRPNRFVLFTHGDLPEQVSVKNTYEQGVYMPLYRRDLLEFSPKRVFMGHIHISTPDGNVQYPGSPSGLDITETGQRYFIVYDTQTDTSIRIPVSTDIVYFNEKITLVPGDHEDDQLAMQIRELRSVWDQLSANNAKLILRVTISGFSTNRGSIASKYKTLLAEKFNNIEIDDINTDDLSAFSDRSLSQATLSIQERIAGLNMRPTEPELMPDNDLILQASLKILFGGRS